MTTTRPRDRCELCGTEFVVAGSLYKYDCVCGEAHKVCKTCKDILESTFRLPRMCFMAEKVAMRMMI